MSKPMVLRIGALGAVCGGVLIVVGNAIHPRESGQLDNAENFLEAAASSDLWVADHVVIGAGITLLLGAFYGLMQSINGRGAPIARLGWGMAIIGVGLGIVFMLTEIVAVSALADEWADSSGAAQDQAFAAGNAIFQMSLALSAGAALFLFGLTPMLYGAAILASDDFATWMGWTGVIAGAAGSVAGVVQLFTGITTVTGLIVIPLGIVVVVLWIIYLGIQMWKKIGTT